MQEQRGALDIPVLAECRALHWERGRSTSRSLFEGVIVLKSVKCQPSSCFGPSSLLTVFSELDAEFAKWLICAGWEKAENFQ